MVPWLAGGMLAIALAMLIAWIDGGEEPRHMIIQPVALPSASESGAGS